MSKILSEKTPKPQPSNNPIQNLKHKAIPLHSIPATKVPSNLQKSALETQLSTLLPSSLNKFNVMILFRKTKILLSLIS
jgi:hypothetical protein